MTCGIEIQRTGGRARLLITSVLSYTRKREREKEITRWMTDKQVEGLVGP